MKTFGKLLTLILLAAFTESVLAYFIFYGKGTSRFPRINSSIINKKAEAGLTLERLKQHSALARVFARSNGYNTRYCLFIDLKILSGKKRCFVYNLEKDSVELAGLVTHGSGSGKGGEACSFSNKPNSYCTSLGRYRIGQHYSGRFGLAYKLYGLDDSNNQAFERFVVLHAHPCVPADEVAPATICESWGCPTLAPGYLSSVKKYIDKSQQPVLLWIYF